MTWVAGSNELYTHIYITNISSYFYVLAVLYFFPCIMTIGHQSCPNIFASALSQDGKNPLFVCETCSHKFSPCLSLFHLCRKRKPSWGVGPGSTGLTALSLQPAARCHWFISLSLSLPWIAKQPLMACETWPHWFIPTSPPVFLQHPCSVARVTFKSSYQHH